MRRHRHWQNRGQAEDCVFVTTRCINFAHCFSSEHQRNLVAQSVLSDCRYYDAPLHSFVVMSNHIHLLLNVPTDRDARWLVQRLKTNSSKLVNPTLIPDQVRQMKDQEGLNNRVMWERGFKSTVILSSVMFDQKIHYIEFNPVRAGLVTAPEEYKWSSLWLLAQGAVDSFGDIDYERALRLYQ